MSEAHNPRLKALMLQVVDNQISENNPPATKLAMKRLMENGYSRQEAKEKIAAIVSESIFDIMKYGDQFDEEKYVSKLEALK